MRPDQAKLSWKPNLRTTGVATATLVLLVAAASLTGRLLAEVRGDRPAPEPPPLIDPGPAPPAVVPAPRRLAPSELPAPACWSCPTPKGAPTSFTVDLDLLAPLGDGTGNAALWLRQFTKGDGSRTSELAGTIRREVRGGIWNVYPPDHPLVREAEDWIDQAHCRFYPDVWPVEGYATQVPNLLFALNLARTWIARGSEADDPAAAKEDYRRAVRLGRLLLQDDAVLITHLVGLACVRLGGEALYEGARREGDAATMLVAARVLAETDAMRLIASGDLVSVKRVLSGLGTSWFGRPTLDVRDEDVFALTQLAGEARPFQMEAIAAMRIVYHMGTSDQIDQVQAALERLASSEDELVAGEARRALSEPFSPEELRQIAFE